MGFKFKTLKNNVFSWENEFVKVQYSQPYIQASDDYAFIKNSNSILYYYYVVDLYTRNDEDKWKKVASIMTHDAPCIQQLQYLLETFIEDKITDKDCQKVNYYSHFIDESIIGYNYTLTTEGFWCDDYYQIERLKKVRKVKGEEETSVEYNLFVGLSPREGSCVNNGIKVLNLEKEDLQALLNCVNAFIQYSIDVHNETRRNENKQWTTYMQVVGDKAFKVKDNHIEDMFVKDTTCSITRLIGNLNEDNFASQEYENCHICDIRNNKIIIDTGYYYENQKVVIIKEKVEIPVNEIIYMSEDVPDKRINYSFDEIVDDWISILNDEEKKEFVNKSIEELNEKWNDAIIDRSWMCRTEHTYFAFDDYDGYNHTLENVKKVAKQVIVKVQTILRNNEE